MLTKIKYNKIKGMMDYCYRFSQFKVKEVRGEYLYIVED